MAKKENFDTLYLSDQWKKYFKNYAQGVTVIEQLIHWISQVNLMTKNVNEWNDYLDNFVNTYDKRLEGTMREVLEEMIASGRFTEFLAEVLAHVDDVKAYTDQKISAFKDEVNKQLEDEKKLNDDKMAKLLNDFEIIKGELTKKVEDLINTTNALFGDEFKKVQDLLNSSFYKVNLTEMKGKDISSFIKTYPETTSFYLPQGIYYLDEELQLKEYQQIEGAGDNTIIKLRKNGMISLNFHTLIKDVKFTADSSMVWSDSRAVLKMKSSTLDQSSLNGIVYYKQKANITLLNITADKIFNKYDKSKFLLLYGKNENDTLSGFWNLHADNIIVDGFSYPLYMEVYNGWLNANSFVNWRIDNFEYGIYFKGTTISGNNDRMGGNKFDKWTIQPTDSKLEKIFYNENVNAFANTFTNIDIWDIMRYKIKPWQLGNVEVQEYTNNYTPASHYFNHQVFSNVLFADRIYPLGNSIDDDVTTTIHMEYFESEEAHMNIYVRGDVVTFIQTKFMSNTRFKIKRDDKGTYYLIVGTSSATGTLSILGSKNLARHPLYFLYDTDVNWNLHELTEIKRIDGEVITNNMVMMNGHAGQVLMSETGDIVTVDVRLNSTAMDNPIVCKLREPANGKISFGNELSISDGGYLNHTSSDEIRYTFSYIRKL